MMEEITEINENLDSQIEPQEEIQEEKNPDEIPDTVPEEISDKEIPAETDNSDSPILRVSSLYKSFGRKQVVRGVDFSMKTGEVLGLLGPNGAGKTTTFYMVVGFYKPTQGDVFLDDQCITGLPMYKRAQLGIAYLPQEASVFRHLTVEDNIKAILEFSGKSKEEQRDRLESLISEFNIEKVRHNKGNNLFSIIQYYLIDLYQYVK